ncbi:MAG: ArdC-like ssDNA-binding domain-containing protein, partial [Acidimicrobiia bacterium]|nr:ArdC-like ssDNA-binding domain-containing protein [Acidimicrobiia bacterium]
MERLHDQLQTSLRELVTSEDWQRALAVAARFHDYSFANSRLIWSQAISRGFQPSRVAGYRMWQRLGRQVRRGEHGLQILAPVIAKVTPQNDDEDERRVVGFRVVRVFDIAQTDGEPLPEVTTVPVEGDLPSQWERVGELIIGAGFGLQVADLDRLGDANGITDWHQRDVVVRASLPGAQRFKTAIHELAHIRLHEPTTEGRPKCRGIVEVEA